MCVYVYVRIFLTLVLDHVRAWCGHDAPSPPPPAPNTPYVTTPATQHGNQW